nr:EOG090X03YR [Eulimnadia texana]
MATCIVTSYLYLNVLGHTRRVSIPDCVEFLVTTNACRGFCESWSIPSTWEAIVKNPAQLVTSIGQCCNIMETEDDHDTIMEAHKQKQHKLILQLKQQLEDLERYAYETGEAGLPQTVLVERQKVIIDQLKRKLQLNVDELDTCSVEDLRHQVDMAISQLVNPLKMKEQLVTQLKTQITDLERFIEFLQGPNTLNQNQDCKHCTTKRPDRQAATTNKADMAQQEKVQQTLRKISNLLQLYIVSQFGCGGNIARNVPSDNTGDSGAEYKARLDAAILHVLRVAQDNDDPDEESDAELLKSVRKVLCPALRNLMAHGLVEPSKNTTSLIPFFSCAAPPRSRPLQPSTHPWQLLLKYYRVKDGDSVMTNPQRSLAESFSLEIHGGTSKHSLLAAIGNVIASHEPFKRSPDANFKSFVCKALNEKKLGPWLRIIFRSPGLIKENYEPWSHAAKTGFDDALKFLDKLQNIPFRLAEDVAVRSLRNISEAF